MKKISLVLLLATAFCCAQAQQKREEIVAEKAEALLRNGLNAGDSYNEIWIRDLNTFIELACKVGDVNIIKESLLMFFKFQGADGNIVDGYVKTTDARYSRNTIGA